MRHCDECRTLIDHLHPEVSRLAPAMAELLRVDASPPEGMRDRFLRRALHEGLHLSAGNDLLHTPDMLARIKPAFWTRVVSFWENVIPRNRSLVFSAAGACLLVVGLAGIRVIMVQRELRWSSEASAATASKTPINIIKAPLPVQWAPASAQAEKELRAQIADISQRLELTATKAVQLEASNVQLERSLMAASQQVELGAAEREAQRRASLSENAELIALRQQLADAKSKVVMLDAVAAAQEKQTTDAEARVATLKAEMDQMYAARGTAEAMISSRNLHIIDVYDDTGKGGRQGAFGRVFYVEGKSLVFYAYDLPNPKHGQSFSFQLWGEGQGLEPTTYKLGLMRPDTAARGRWVVACDDPKVLGQLRGVFIAPASMKGDPPSPSQKLMYAMLGSANHP
jgi:hypothetical protein